MQLPSGSLLRIDDYTRPNFIRFCPKTDGKRVWGILENCSDKTMLITPRSDLYTMLITATHLDIPDLGIKLIERRDRALHCRGVESWMSEFPELFSPQLGTCKTYTVTQLPFKSGIHIKRQTKPPSLGPAEEEELWNGVQGMIQEGIVSETDMEPFAMPLFAIRKKDGNATPILDMRLLNGYLHREPFLRVNRDHSIASVRPYTVGSSLDLSRAYNQVQLDPQIRKYFGFSLKGRMFHYNRVPFGYANAPYEFLRALHRSLVKMKTQIQSQLVVYMDDLILLSTDQEVHRDDLRTVISILQEDGWRLNGEKSKFETQSFSYLGMKLEPNGWKPDDDSVRQLREVEPPKSTTEWRRVKGWLTQLSRFILNGDLVMQALSESELSGNPDHWKRFLGLLEEHMVRCAHPEKEGAYSICVDASLDGWGSCLIQTSKIICCASGKWGKHFRHKRSNELEAEALVFALHKFRPFVYGCEISVYTDNAATWSLGNPANTSPFILRRLDQILEFSPRLKFVDGRSNVIPDFLSRLPQLMTLDTTTTRLLRKAHEGHFGPKKTMERLRRLGGTALWREVKLWIQHCEACQQFKKKSSKLPLGQLSVSDVRDVWSIDYIGPLDKAEGNVQFIFTVVDFLSRFTWTASCQRTDVKTTQRLLSRCFQELGKPKAILSDAASYFTSKKFQNWLRDQGLEGKLAGPHAHHSNGRNERLNQNLIGRIRRMMIEGRNRPSWRGVLERATRVINDTPNDTTKYPPKELWMKGKLRGQIPLQAQTSRDEAEQRTREMLEAINQKCRPKTYPSFQLNDQVWLYDHVRANRLDHKFKPFWIGPYVVIEVSSDHLRVVENMETGKQTLVHVDSLQNYYPKEGLQKIGKELTSIRGHRGESRVACQT